MPRVLNFLNYKRVGLPPGAVYIGRKNRYYHLPASKWANEIAKLGRNASLEERMEVIVQYERWLCDSPQGQALLRQIDELRGRDLVCWCAPEPCHGDVLLRLANPEVGTWWVHRQFCLR